MQYALAVSYVNGAGALLRTFSSDRKEAIEEINDMDKDEFSATAGEELIRQYRSRYIWKVQKAMDAVTPLSGGCMLPDAFSTLFGSVPALPSEKMMRCSSCSSCAWPDIQKAKAQSRGGNGFRFCCPPPDSLLMAIRLRVNQKRPSAHIQLN